MLHQSDRRANLLEVVRRLCVEVRCRCKNKG
jgi:hypothetical protein